MKRSLLIVLGLALLQTSFTGSNEKLEYYRVKYGSQLEKYDYRSRTTAADWQEVSSEMPETVPLFVLSEEGTGTHRTKLSEEFETFIDNLNKNNERILRYLKANNSELFNTAGFPQLESLTMGGNAITLVEIEGDWGKVHTLDPGQIYSPEEVSYITYPDLIHKFVVVGWRKNSRETYWTNPPPGDMYWPLVSSHDVWIIFERL